MELIRFENVSKYFDKSPAIRNITLTINSGDTVVLLGPSGCGKTTLLKLINRLLLPNEGKIYFQGKDISQLNPLSLRRKMGYVIQDVGLFPHLTIEENITIPIKISDQKPREGRVTELLNLVGLDEEFARRYPRELSGGQQQRVGIARALANEPQLILMDEPFSALDNITRAQLQDDFLGLENLLKKTTILVTHDIYEAFKLADQIVLLNQGVIQQAGPPLALLHNPSNDFVGEFLKKDKLLLEMQYQEYEWQKNKSSTFMEAIENDAISADGKAAILWKLLEDMNKHE